MIEKTRAFVRLTLFILVLAFYVTRLLITGLFKGLTLELGLNHRQQCAKTLIKVLGIEVAIKGKLYEGNYLYISNHRCYLDPVVQLSYITALPVAKAEVKKIPILGYGAKISGVHYVHRESLKSRKDTRNNIAQTIASGKSILIYPEGTTFDTPTTGSFKPGTFHMAAQNKVEIIPIAIEYRDESDYWVEESMPAHFFSTFGKKNKHLEVRYGDPIWLDNGEELLLQVQTWIDNQLIEMRTNWGLPLEKKNSVRENKNG